MLRSAALYPNPRRGKDYHPYYYYLHHQVSMNSAFLQHSTDRENGMLVGDLLPG
jgi:hypothetical protein